MGLIRVFGIRNFASVLLLISSHFASVTFVFSRHSVTVVCPLHFGGVLFVCLVAVARPYSCFPWHRPGLIRVSLASGWILGIGARTELVCTRTEETDSHHRGARRRNRDVAPEPSLWTPSPHEVGSYGMAGDRAEGVNMV